MSMTVEELDRLRREAVSEIVAAAEKLRTLDAMEAMYKPAGRQPTEAPAAAMPSGEKGTSSAEALGYLAQHLGKTMTFSRRTKAEADKARRAFHSNGSARRLKAQGYVIRAWKHETDPLRFYVKVEKGGRAASAGARR